VAGPGAPEPPDPLSDAARLLPETGQATGAVLVQPDDRPPPRWATVAGARVLAPGALDADDALEDVECVLLDASVPGFVSLARRVHALDASVQVIAVTAPAGLQATRRALLYAPGLGEVWVASPTEVSGALTERAAGVTRQRRRYERTRARIERERMTASPQRAERALISDAYLAGLLRVLPDPVFSVDGAGRVLSANAAAEQAFARADRHLVGAPLGELLGIAAGPGGESALLRRAASEQFVQLEFRRADGSLRSGELRSAAMDAGDPGAWAVVLRDVTEQQAIFAQARDSAMELEAANEELQASTEELMQRTTEAEQAAAAMRESEATYRALVDALPTLAWTARADGYIDWYNQRWYQYTGTTPGQMEGWGWQRVHDPAVLPTVLARWQASIESGIPFEMTFPLRGADGHQRSFLTRVVPLRDDRGTVVRWFGTNTDVEAERAARVRVERLQALTEALAASHTIEDVAAVVVAQAVAAAGATTGMLVVRPPGTDEAVIVQQTGLDPDTLRRYARFGTAAPGPAAECLRTGAPIFVESREGGDGLLARFPQIADVWTALGTHSVACVPLAAGGAVVGAMSFTFPTPRAFSDEERAFFLALGRQCGQAVERARLFAAERTAREQADSAAARADEANRAKSQFLANMSHELRTPLNAIGGYVQLIGLGLHGPVTDAQREALERVNRAQRHLLGLINDVLNYARIEGGRVEYDLQEVPLAGVLADVEGMVGPQVRARGLTLEVHAGSGGAPAIAMADREKLVQVLLNLLSNAIKFTAPGGRVTAAVADDEDGPAGAWVYLRVSDTGIGIPAEKLDSIFEPFVQVRSDFNRSTGGTGLGLAISRDLARGMGGDLTVRSSEGVGSAFVVRLQRAPHFPPAAAEGPA
jgi:PAS domain S-box-containing protein